MNTETALKPSELADELERLTLENGPIIIDKYGEELAWRPIDFGTWTPLHTQQEAAKPEPSEAMVERVARAIMDALWPLLGGNHTEADLWNEIAEAINTAATASLSPADDTLALLREARKGFASIRDDWNFTSAKCRAEYELRRIDTTLAKQEPRDDD